MIPSLLYSLLYSNIYNKYIDIITNIVNKDNKELNKLLYFLEVLHKKYDKDISLEEFSVFVLSNVPDKDKDTYSLVLTQMREAGPSDIIEDVIRDLHQKQVAYDLALKALEASEGRLPFEELCGYSQQHLNATESATEASTGIVTQDLTELLEGSVKTQGLRWRLNTLNQMMGSLRKGNFGFIFARPETGKTTFLASEVTYFAEQTAGRPILWFNNEEDGAAVALRLFQASLGATLTELRAFPQESNERYVKHGGANIKLIDSATIHRRQVEQLCQQYDPALIVFDQLDKVKGFVGDREDIRLGSIYIWARELAKQYCPVIAVSQADVSGEGKKYLTMENVANAKTAKQAEADWILGIGATHNDAEQFDRFLHLSKNKLIGDTDTIPELRHGKATVKIVPDIARYTDY